MAEQTVDPMEALKVILAQLTANQTTQMMDFAKELKKPSEREQRNLDEEDAKIARAQKERLEMGRAEVQRKEMNARSCGGHVRVHPGTGVTRHLWRAQVHAPDGRQPYIMPTCQNCQTQVGPIPASMEMIRNGVSLENYPALTEEALRKWAEQYKA
jgi:hypothetical protein